MPGSEFGRPAFPGGKVFTIPPHVGFVDALAAGLMARLPDPLARARALVLLPNRRAARALTEAFMRLTAAPGAASGLLLPRMVPVSDIGEDDFDRLAEGDTPLPPPIDPLIRRLELARLVRQLPAAGAARSALECLRLGDALAATLDELQAAEIAPEALRDAVAEQDLASHWQATLACLEVIISAWPPARAALGGSDGGTRLTAAVAALTARWAAAPPSTPVIAAGITSTTPAVLRLLRAILSLPAGAVLLAGLDTDQTPAGEARWEACLLAGPDASEIHPQHGLKAMLAALGRSRAEVADWGHGGPRDGPAGRSALLFAALAPAGTGEGWAELPDGMDRQGAEAALAGVRVIEAATAAEEAQAIALALREALETPGRTAALVTPDRTLGSRVAAHCRRWGIAIDDSAGTPLTATPPATLLLALATALSRGFAPVPLLAVLKHPLVSPAGADAAARAAWLAQARALDLGLRGVRPAPGLDGISARLDETGAPAALAGWWRTTAALMAPLEQLAGRPGLTLASLSQALIDTANALAGERVWAGPAGRALAERLSVLASDGALFGPVGAAEAPALLSALLADLRIRPPWSGHPRLAILGPLEAQLARFDLMVLGGLNEGVWPAQPAPDPWLPPAIRARLGLPGTARAMGLAAQDFLRAAAAPRLLLSRARRDAAGPMRASRLLLRLDALAARVNGSGLMRDTRLLALARGLDRPARVTPVQRPAPAPPAADRPARLSVTAIDTLIADPFAFYARTMLKLPVLDPLDQDPGAAERGTILHGVLEDWVKGGVIEMAALEPLIAAMLAREGGNNPLLRALWGPRAERALRWAGERVIEGLAQGRMPLAAEVRGSLRLANGILLTGIADRLDRLPGGLALVDYKSGSPPRVHDVRERRANQLPLLALMLAEGGLGEVRGTAVRLEYWRLRGSAASAGEVQAALGAGPLDLAEHLAAVRAEVTALTDQLLRGTAPFRPHVHPALVWGDYDHLARVLEWRDRA